MKEIYKGIATCVDKKVYGGLRRKHLLFGAKEKNEFAEYHLYFEIDNERCDFLVSEFEYDCVEVGDCGAIEYEYLLNSYKIIRFKEQIDRR